MRHQRKLFHQFLDANRAASAWVEAKLPNHFRRNFKRIYEGVVASYINSRPGQVIVDVGGGKSCPYFRFLENPSRQMLISVDISFDELQANREADLKVVADVTAALPFASRSIDLISSRSVIEHLHDVPRFIENCRSVLRNGGYMIHVFPGRYAPFAAINRLLPHQVSQALLYYFHPTWKDDCGFQAYYDHCDGAAMQRLLADNGFEIIRQELGYYQAQYFNFFFPLYITVVFYDLIMDFLGMRKMCSQMLFVTRLSG